MNRPTPKIQLHAEVYQQAYAAVLHNPYWYSDRPRLLKETFNAENTRRRADIVIDILRRAGRRRTERHLSQQYLSLVDKLSACRLEHCGSSACLECLRAFQQAKTVAHRRVLSQLAAKYPRTLWCIISIIPLELNYPHGTLQEFDADKFNLHLKETLTWGGLIRPFLGSIDFSLETSRFGKYWQPHWHFTLHTSDPKLLREYLKDLFPPMEKHDYPVDVKEAVDLNFLPYIHKVIKINDLMRTGRTQLPELLLALDRINPLDPMVFHGLVLSAQNGRLDFELSD
jgi:hypothetical protein